MFIYLRSVTESLVIFPQILILTILDGDQKFQRSSLSQDIHQQEIVKGLSLKMYVFVLLSNPLYLVFRGRCLSKSGCPGGVFSEKLKPLPSPPHPFVFEIFMDLLYFQVIFEPQGKWKKISSELEKIFAHLEFSLKFSHFLKYSTKMLYLKHSNRRYKKSSS